MDYQGANGIQDTNSMILVHDRYSELFYKFHENFDLQLLYSYRKDDSNIGIYDYDRNMYSIGIEWRYQ